MAAITALSHAGATQWIPIKVENGAFLIETRIGGIDGYSLIDTGASINGINQRFIRANQLDLACAEASTSSEHSVEKDARSITE